MKKTLSILLTLFSFSILFTVNPVRAGKEKSVYLVVSDFDVFLIKKQYGKLVSEMVSSNLGSSDKINIVERSKIEKVIKELELSQTGLINPDDALKTGKLLGANKMIVGSVGKLGLKYVINARVIDIESGRVIKGFSVSGNSQEDLVQLSSYLAGLIQGILIGIKPADNIHSLPQGEREQGESAGLSDSAQEKLYSHVSGYWVTEWYDVNGKHSGSMYLEQSGNSLTGWTVENIGPAQINAQVNGNSIKGKYTAKYGSGIFEFTVSSDKNKLIGSYKADHIKAWNTWNGWRGNYPSSKYKVGEKVLADWSGDFWSYPGTVKQTRGNSYFIQYLDGDSEWLDEKYIFKYKLNPGDVVYLSQKSRTKYIYATVLESGGDEVLVEYKDGRKSQEHIKNIRLLIVRKDGY